MKNVEKYLNNIQLAHLRDPSKCNGKKCKLPNCVHCLCDMREDSKFCCAPHRSAAGNLVFKARHSHINEYASSHRSNTLIIEDFYSRNIIRFEQGYLTAATFDFTYTAPKVMVDGREASLFGDIAMWLDSQGFFNLQKIK